MEHYEPPFTINEDIINLTAEIAELSGILSISDTLSSNPVLRRENRIRTIHSSLAIENNTLSIDQVTAVIGGKRVLAPPDDIKEVQNAYEFYNQMDRLNPYSLDDLLYAHRIMTQDLIKESGRFRSGNAGVYAGQSLIHAGTPAAYVPSVMHDLFDWLKNSSLHPLIKSCIFHYEFEYIHPFADGNGRTGRLWHTLILSKWKPFFSWVPIETLIHDHQEDYYKALNESNNRTDSAPFVNLMLELIKQILLEIQNTSNVSIESLSDKVLLIIKTHPTYSANKIASMLGISNRQVERIIKKLRESGVLIRHGATKGGYWEVI